MARPTLADSLKASLNKGVHVDTAEKIARGFDVEAPAPSPASTNIPPLATIDIIDADAAKAKSSDQAINRAIKQTIEQAGRQSNRQTDNQADSQTNNQAINQSTEQALQQLTRQPSNQTVEQSIEQSPKQTIEQLTKQSEEQSIGQAIKQSPRLLWLPLNENQGRILLFLYESGEGLTNMDILCMETGIAYGTARAAFDILVKEGYVIGKSRHNGHAFRGFEYTLNNHLCSLYVSRVRGSQLTGQSFQQSIKQSSNQTINQAVTPFSSSLKDLKLTTTKTDAENEAADILSEPELRFWAAEGVTEKQVRKWMDEFQMTEDEIKVSLRYARFDILERNDVQNPANWFYKIVARNSFYPCPPNYRSPLELRAEAVKQQQERDNEAKKKVEQADFESSFQAFLANPDSPLYQELFAQINSFSKEQFKAGERMEAEIELKELFRQREKKGEVG